MNASGGVRAVLLADGMARGPRVHFAHLGRAGAAKVWLDSEEGFRVEESAFNSTSRFGRLQNMETAIDGSSLFIRFKSSTGAAMGMNMIS